MWHIKRAVWMALLLFSIGVAAQSASGYPTRLGVVNDYAGKLDEAQIQELTALIQNYERQTSIEFVVVIVNTLDGTPVGTYTRGLGDAWGVGKAGRNNGVVLLWAPKERAYSLRIANGLTPDLSDDDAHRLTSQHLLPYFKHGEYYTGLKETVETTMAHLGNETWEQRLQARGQRTVQEEHQPGQSGANSGTEGSGWLFLLFMLFLAIAVLIGIMLYKAHAKREKLAELSKAGEEIEGDLRKAESNRPELQQRLEDFARTMPEQDLTALRDGLARQPERIAKIRADLQYLNFSEADSYEEMVRVRTSAEDEADLLETTTQQIARITQAKEQSHALLQELSRENFQISGVRDSSKIGEVNRLLSQGRQDYQQAQQNSSMSLLDWVLINELLNNSRAQVRQAVECSQQNPYVASSDSSWSSSSDSGFSSSSGGGFSSGSGSDGSY